MPKEPEQKWFPGGYTDHGDHGWAVVESDCPICGEPYECYADDDTGCPNGCDSDSEDDEDDDL